MAAVNDNIRVEILRRAADDWVPVIEVEDDVVRAFGADADSGVVRAAVVEVIGYLVSNGLAVIGHIEERGFVPYEAAEMNIPVLVSSVLDAPDPMGAYSRLWLSITPLGVQQVRPS